MNIHLILSIVFYISFFIYLLVKIRKDLHIVQQNSYYNSRYFQWIKKNFLKLLIPFEIVNLFLLLGYIAFEQNSYIKIVVSILFVWGSYYELNKKQKKKLVFTQRATRLYGLTIALYIIFSLGVLPLFTTQYLELCQVILLIISPFMLLLANLIILPIENKINDWYYNDAKERLSSVKKINKNFKVVGITGSYGKTSTKHFLYDVLSTKYNVLSTPGSVNTPMGIVKILRTELKNTHTVLIAEMGAKRMGDVKEICDLVNPSMAILTAVGPEHLDTFGSMDNVERGNFELIESLPNGGIAILNADYERIRKHTISKSIEPIFYTVEGNKAEISAQNINYTNKGLEFDIYQKNKFLFKAETKLLGIYNVSNILATIAVAIELDIEYSKIIYAIRNLKPIEHRLDIKTHANGITIIDDAFNSNPKGAEMALEVLGKVKGDRKIIVTPGMIELGEEEDKYNYEFGKQIAQVCDYVILVGPQKTLPIKNGLLEANYAENKLYVASTLNEAVNHLKTFSKSGDVILYENDLPDTYNE